MCCQTTEENQVNPELNPSNLNVKYAKQQVNLEVFYPTIAWSEGIPMIPNLYIPPSKLLAQTHKSDSFLFQIEL